MSVNRSLTAKTGLKPSAYGSFGGLDTSRDIANMDTKRELCFSTLDNGYVDWRSQVVRDPTLRLRLPAARVRHLRYFEDDKFVWAQQDDSEKYSFGSTNNHYLTDVYPASSVVSSVVFNRSVFLMAAGQHVFAYNGGVYRKAESLSNLRHAFGASVSRRLCVAGMPTAQTRIDISRVDSETFAYQEQQTDTSVLRAGFIDIKNMLSNNETITGLSQFEQDRLAVFTQGRTIIFKIDPDQTQWQLDERANIKIGCISHNTICQAGTDLLFCSRSGVHSVQRTSEAGILIYSRSMSDRIDQLYRRLLKTVSDPASVTAVFDQDEARYRVFFPSPSGLSSHCLSLSINPEGGEPTPTWSTSSFLNATCGDSMNGRLALGGPDGVYEVNKIEDTGELTPAMTIQTPYLWHGNTLDKKDTHSLIIQASGSGTIEIEATNDSGNMIFARTVEVEGDDNDDSFTDVPIFREYDIPFQHSYRGVRFKFVCKGNGLFRLFGFAVTFRNQ